MRYLKTYELFGFGKKKYFQGIKSINNVFNKEGEESIIEPFYELTDIGFEVNELRDSDNFEKFPLVISVHKGNRSGILTGSLREETFTLNDEIKDIIFSGVKRIEDKFQLSLSKIIIQYEWDPQKEADKEDKLIIGSEKEWDKKIKPIPVYKIKKNGEVEYNMGGHWFYGRKKDNTKWVFSVNLYFN